MTDATAEGGTHQSAEARRRLRRRYGRERRFRRLGAGAVSLAALVLVVLIGSIAARGYSAFWQWTVHFEVELDPEVLDPTGQRTREALSRAHYAGLVKARLRELFPEVATRRERRDLYGLVSSGAAFELRERVLADPSLVGRSVALQVPVSDEADMLLKGHRSRDVPEHERQLNDRQLAWLDAWREEGRLERSFNARFFTSGDSREPELAGLGGALVGSLLTLAVTLLLSFPVGVAAAVYLEEFAPRNRWTDWIEVNINNLAAVPSIVFGLLGLAVFLNFFGLPRSAPLVGGMVLALMTLPTIIIASRAALKAVPPSIREGALAIGASPLQTVTHHVLPLALPGILTGTIIGLAQALGETAPLLMIGMVAFIVDVPTGPTDPATVLPVQVFLWADSPERAFQEKTAGAILVLLAFLVAMNLTAVLLRHRFERRW